MDSGDREQVGTAAGRAADDESGSHAAAGSYRTHFDPADRSAIEATIAAVAAATGADAMELPPLYDAVDPDALAAMFEPPRTGASRFRGSVAFEYADTLVRVDGHGTVEVSPSAAAGGWPGVGAGRATGCRERHR